MRFFRFFSNFCALLALPSLIFPQIPNVYTIPAYEDSAQSGSLLSYDEILDLIDEIAEVEIPEDYYTADELAGIANLLATLARHGTPNTDLLALERDIQSYLHNSAPYFVPCRDHWNDLAYGTAPMEITECRGWLSKQCRQIKKFTKEHKTAIIIGAAVVVAVVAIVVVVSVASASAAATAAAGAIAESTANGSREQHLQSAEPAYRQEAVEEFTHLATLLEGETAPVQEIITKQCGTEDPNGGGLVGFVRQMGSHCAHGFMRELDTISLETAHTKEVLRDLAVQILPERFGPFIEGNPVEECSEGVVARHEYIDRLFSTNLTERYLPQEENEDAIQYEYGILPPPGFLGKSSGAIYNAERTAVGVVGDLVTATERMPPTQVSDVVGWELRKPINNRTFLGREPKWTTVRQRYWKNRADSYPHEYVQYPGALERMKRGLAPQRFVKLTNAWESKELHHNPAQRHGGRYDFVEVWPEEHEAVDEFRNLGK